MAKQVKKVPPNRETKPTEVNVLVERPWQGWKFALGGHGVSITVGLVGTFGGAPVWVWLTVCAIALLIPVAVMFMRIDREGPNGIITELSRLLELRFEGASAYRDDPARTELEADGRRLTRTAVRAVDVGTLDVSSQGDRMVSYSVYLVLSREVLVVQTFGDEADALDLGHRLSAMLDRPLVRGQDEIFWKRAEGVQVPRGAGLTTVAFSVVCLLAAQRLSLPYSAAAVVAASVGAAVGSWASIRLAKRMAGPAASSYVRERFRDARRSGTAPS